MLKFCRCQKRKPYGRRECGVLFFAIYLGIVAALATGLLLHSCDAKAEGYFGEIGAGQFLLPADGTWWQKSFEHEFDNKNAYYRIGLEWPTGIGKAWRAFGFNLGEYRLDAKATPNDKNYNPASPTGCNGECLPLARFRTSGGVYGLGVSYNFPLYSRLWAEIGPTYYQQKFTLMVDNHGALPNGYTQGPYRRWAIGNIVGLRYEGAGYSLGFYHYHLGAKYSGDSEWPTGVERYLSLAVGLRF